MLSIVPVNGKAVYNDNDDAIFGIVALVVVVVVIVVVWVLIVFWPFDGWKIFIIKMDNM